MSLFVDYPFHNSVYFRNKFGSPGCNRSTMEDGWSSRNRQHHSTPPISGAPSCTTVFRSPDRPPLANRVLLTMGLSKTEINFRRLLAAAPQQHHQSKLIHYVGTLREQLEQLAAERTPEGLPRISKATLSDYSEKVEAIAANLVSLELNTVESLDPPTAETSVNQTTTKTEEHIISPSPGLRRRIAPSLTSEDRSQSTIDASDSATVKLDAAAQAHITKHRKLQEDLTDEMVGLARQLKESTLMMNQSIKNTEKILDSTEEAVERSLASTGRANTQAMAIYSESSKTSCFTWLVMLLMTCIFVMVVLLIKVT
ncbi:hypothetical protein L1987_29154 [Smallanthus sonchifolius]|uniref:Uncharacterized protein n=1 Tax=Smallanthus sonchifolius TaxID=185202 RepID=A0ACB9HYK9_9ASTR|nr:hypothetical protein L1987_29154 [Smallanthus sonchifolius]